MHVRNLGHPRSVQTGLFRRSSTRQFGVNSGRPASSSSRRSLLSGGESTPTRSRSSASRAFRTPWMLWAPSTNSRSSASGTMATFGGPKCLACSLTMASPATTRSSMGRTEPRSTHVRATDVSLRPSISTRSPLADLEPVPGDAAAARKRAAILSGEMKEPSGLPEMRSAFLAPRHRFDDGGHRPAVVGPELRPRRQRNAVDFRCRDQAGEDVRIKCGVRADEGGQVGTAGPGHADAPAWAVHVAGKEPAGGDAGAGRLGNGEGPATDFLGQR